MRTSQNFVATLNNAGTITTLESYQSLLDLNNINNAYLANTVEACRLQHPDPSNVEFDIFMFKIYLLSQRSLDKQRKKFFEVLNMELRKYEAGVDSATPENQYTAKQREDIFQSGIIQTRNYKYYMARRQALKYIDERLPAIITSFEQKAADLLSRWKSCDSEAECARLDKKYDYVTNALGDASNEANLENLHGLQKQIKHECLTFDFKPNTATAGPLKFKPSANPHVVGEFLMLNDKNLKKDPTINALNEINRNKIHTPLSGYFEEMGFLRIFANRISDIFKNVFMVRSHALSTFGMMKATRKELITVLQEGQEQFKIAQRPRITAR